MNYPESSREQLADAIIQGATHPYITVQSAHQRQFEVPRQRTPLRERVRSFHDQRSGDPIYQLGCILGGVGLAAGGVSVVAEIANNSEIAQGSGALGAGLGLLGLIVASQA